MRHKSTILLLALIAVIFTTVFSVNGQQITKLQQGKTLKDSTKIAAITTDTIKISANPKLMFFKKKAHASYYADKFNGRRTTSGIRFNNNKYTAAHRKFAFGTKLKITNEVNGKWVIVEVIDRGPFIKGREIDLTKRAFMDIASNKRSGAVIVTIELVME